MFSEAIDSKILKNVGVILIELEADAKPVPTVRTRCTYDQFMGKENMKIGVNNLLKNL